MDERCEVTDLLKQQCGHCQDVQETKPEYGPWFQARYDGECDGCGEEFERGDTIRSDGEGGYLFGDCGEQS